MTVRVEHGAYPVLLNDGTEGVKIERAVMVSEMGGARWKTLSCSEVALTSKEALRLAGAIRHPSSIDYGSRFFEDADTGMPALHADLVPMESFFLYWIRERGEDPTDSLWDTVWPDVWADEIERAAREAQG